MSSAGRSPHQAKPASPAARDYEPLTFADLADRYLHHLFAPSDPPPDGRLGPDLASRTGRAGRALDRLAVSAAIARRVQAGWQFDAATALAAGTSWEQVGRAYGQDPPLVREQFAAWIHGPARLHRTCGLGLDPDQAASACPLLHPPGPPFLPGRHADRPGR